MGSLIVSLILSSFFRALLPIVCMLVSLFYAAIADFQQHFNPHRCFVIVSVRSAIVKFTLTPLRTLDVHSFFSYSKKAGIWYSSEFEQPRDDQRLEYHVADLAILCFSGDASFHLSTPYSQSFGNILCRMSET